VACQWPQRGKVAVELGIRAPLLYRWAHLEREPDSNKTEHKTGRTVAELETEIRRSRAEKGWKWGSVNNS
jgi:transposase-like protein